MQNEHELFKEMTQKHPIEIGMTWEEIARMLQSNLSAEMSKNEVLSEQIAVLTAERGVQAVERMDKMRQDNSVLTQERDATRLALQLACDQLYLARCAIVKMWRVNPMGSTHTFNDDDKSAIASALAVAGSVASKLKKL